MKHPFFTIRRLGLLGAALAVVAATTAPAGAQTISPAPSAAVRAEQQYNLDIAVCNNANFPAPQRASCIRDAGLRLDRQRGVPAVAEPAATADGRATVMTPSTGSATLRGSTTTTTGDGRATVVVPGTTTRP